MLFKKNRLKDLKDKFPEFTSKVRGEVDPEEILPGATPEEIQKEEELLKVPLPQSYKEFLRTYRGFWLFGGAVQFGSQHPFFHSFPKFEALGDAQKGGH